jgi:hypothetical protein
VNSSGQASTRSRLSNVNNWNEEKISKWLDEGCYNAMAPLTSLVDSAVVVVAVTKEVVVVPCDQVWGAAVKRSRREGSNRANHSSID